MPRFLCSSILFDLDGVLVDSTQSVAYQWRRWAEEHGVDPDTVVEAAHGRRTVEVIRLTAPHLDVEAETRMIENRGATEQSGVRVMPGAAALLAAIPDGRWAVVTSGTHYLAANRLRHAKLPVPRVLVAADDVTHGKPHPEPYLKGAQLLGVNPAECLVVEDAPLGIQAARAAGMKVIGLTSTYGPEELSQADAVIRQLSEIQIHAADGQLRAVSYTHLTLPTTPYV